jgi:hypothetical protein
MTGSSMKKEVLIRPHEKGVLVLTSSAPSTKNGPKSQTKYGVARPEEVIDHEW